MCKLTIPLSLQKSKSTYRKTSTPSPSIQVQPHQQPIQPAQDQPVESIQHVQQFLEPREYAPALPMQPIFQGFPASAVISSLPVVKFVICNTMLQRIYFSL